MDNSTLSHRRWPEASHQKDYDHQGNRHKQQAVIAALPFDLLYARLDFLRVNRTLSVIEIELIEPIFSFNLAPESIRRLVDATQRRFRQ